MRVWVLGSFELKAIPQLAILLQHVVRYPESVYPHTAMTPELWTIQILCQWGPSPLWAMQCVKAILQERQFLMPNSTSRELVPPNSLHTIARSFNKPIVKNYLFVQHKVYSHY